ncbi:MAG TPA: AraC family transcriptional regulator ligand-binding domain-containing protein [Solimonas sp.]
MSSRDTARPTVPISYVLLMLDIAADYGVSRERLLEGLGIDDHLLQRPDARIALLDEYARLCIRALKYTGEPGLAYEFGLRATITSHGLLGFGMMSQRTLRDVFTFANRFATTLRLPAWELRFLTENGYAMVDGREAVPHGSLRRFSCEQLLVSLTSIVRHILPDPPVELWFDYPEPEYHARFRERLPPVRFSMPATQIRIPIDYLDAPLRTGDRVAAQLAERECERELALIGGVDDLVKRVRAVLQRDDAGYPDLEAVAERLHVTSRTLNRRLGALGTSYRQLLDQARHADSRSLLEDPALSVSDIALRLGYSSAANFSRAFQNWTGASPGSFRARRRDAQAQ